MFFDIIAAVSVSVAVVVGGSVVIASADISNTTVFLKRSGHQVSQVKAGRLLSSKTNDTSRRPPPVEGKFPGQQRHRPRRAR